MADVKISALPAATTPLAGTEVLPIVQSATTKQVSIANVTAGRAISASSLTLTTPLGVASGGTGSTSLTGILKGNGASAFTAATAGTDYVAPGGALGTPSSGTLTNCTGLPASSVTGLAASATTDTTNASNISSGTLAVARGGSGATATTGTGSNVLSASPTFTGTISGDSASLTGTLAMGSSFLRNRIINGAMAIDQRNAGASVTANNTVYPVDRFYFSVSQTGKGNGQQTPSATETGYATRVNAGFTNYLAFTSSSAYSVASGDYFGIRHAIEGLNVADLAWGTSGAKSVTLSFWVYSSLTGTFGGAVYNSAANRTYPFSYAINSANAWTQISITIAGDTTGTWLTTNGVGLIVQWSLGTGTTYSGTAGSWSGSTYFSASSTVSVVGTNGATFYITGVQLEVGSVATPFERRKYGTELMLCQRYYYRAMTAAVADPLCVSFNDTTTVALGSLYFPVTMRIAPTALEQTGTASNYRVRISGSNVVNCSSVPAFSNATTNIATTTFTVASGLTAGQGTYIQSNIAGNAYLGWSAEL